MAGESGVEVTLAMIARSAKKLRRRNDESLESFAGRMTHVSLCARGISEFANVRVCRKIVALYLYENNIREISPLPGLSNLTHLYLQHNRITRLRNLNNLPSLTKLYLGHNQINVVEGLTDLRNLRELRLERQQLPPGEKLLFDPRCLLSLCDSLRVLDLAGNNLDSLADLAPTRNLTQLYLADNALRSLGGVVEVLRNSPRLSRLGVKGNPFCTMPKYEEEIIVEGDSLQLLDGKEVEPMTRLFLQNWRDAKQRRQKEPGSARLHESSYGAGRRRDVGVLRGVSGNTPRTVLPPI